MEPIILPFEKELFDSNQYKKYLKEQKQVSGYVPNSPETVPQKEPEPKNKKKKTYPQDWVTYNSYQMREKLMGYRLISDVVDFLQIEEKKKLGRPTVNLKDVLKSLCVKEFCGLSSRRLHSELVLLKAMNYIENVYHFNTICKYLGEPKIQGYLKEIAILLATPLREVETCVAIDSSGISTRRFAQKWSDIRQDFSAHREYKKLHILCGVRTGAIFSFDITNGNEADSPFFKPLLSDAVKIFSIKDVCADAGYLSRDNCTFTEEVGARPFILPKKNSTTHPKGSWAYARMVRMWKEKKELWNPLYHRRSKVENTFFRIKIKYGEYVRGKLDQTQTNEIMCKIIAHNLGVLSQAMLQFGAQPGFW